MLIPSESHIVLCDRYALHSHHPPTCTQACTYNLRFRSHRRGNYAHDKVTSHGADIFPPRSNVHTVTNQTYLGRGPPVTRGNRKWLNSKIQRCCLHACVCIDMSGIRMVPTCLVGTIKCFGGLPWPFCCSTWCTSISTIHPYTSTTLFLATVSPPCCHSHSPSFNAWMTYSFQGNFHRSKDKDNGHI